MTAWPIRSATKVTAEAHRSGADRLKVIGRAGIGVDNVDIPAATAAGIIVMNTPFGNSITTAEHAIAMMFALRPPDPRRRRLHPGRQVGEEPLHGRRAQRQDARPDRLRQYRLDRRRPRLGLKMRVVAFDPFLSPERAVELGVEKVELDELLARADFITLHTPLTDEDAATSSSAETSGQDARRACASSIARAAAWSTRRRCAPALDCGQVAGAAFDVFAEEPAKANALFGQPNVVCTPHLGASTTEAQENVALQVAEQMSDYLLTGAVTNALNIPSITAEEAPR